MKKFLMTTTAALLVSASAMAEPFTKDETTQIEGIIKEYILKNPEVLIESLESMQKKMMEKQLEQGKKTLKERRAEIEGGEFFLGNKNGKIVIVKFFDYNCGYCKMMTEILEKTVKKHKDVKLVLKDLPSLSQDSADASLVAIAAHKQGKYAEMYRALSKSQSATKDEALKIAKELKLDMAKLEKDMNSEESKLILAKNREIASALGSQAVPTIIIGDEIIMGATDEANLDKAIEKLRK